MFRYMIYVFTLENNKVKSHEYNARHFEVNIFIENGGELV